jgi:hypothetical protein
VILGQKNFSCSMNRFSADQPVEYEQAHREIGGELNEGFLNGYYSENAKWHGDQGDQDEGQRNQIEGQGGQVAGQNDDSDVGDSDEYEEDNEKSQISPGPNQLSQSWSESDEGEQQTQLSHEKDLAHAIHHRNKA